MWITELVRRRRHAVRPMAAGLAVALLAGCEGVTAPKESQPALLPLYAITPATVRSLIVEVSGPGIAPTLTVNLPVGPNDVASGTIAVLPGAPRRIIVSAVDTAGIISHKADTTVRLLPGANAAINLTLLPLVASAPITVTFGSITIAITSGPSSMIAGDVAAFAATVSGVYGGPVPADSINWGSSDPSVLTFAGSVATAVRAGTSTVTASWRGATATRVVTISPSSALVGTLLVEQSMPTCCEQLSLYRFATASSVVALPQNAGQGDLSPDGTRIVFWRPFDNRIFRANADATGEVVIASGATCYAPRWSFDGARVTYTREVGGGAASREIMLMNADGSGAVQLTSNGAADESPQLSPDGSKVVFHSDRDGNYEVYVMSSNGQNQLRLTNAAGFDGEPSWSPDGSRILFTSNRSGSMEIWAMNADGSGQVALTTGSGGPAAQIGRWSPDGQRFSFRRLVSGQEGIYTARVDGSDVRLVRATPAGVTFEFVRSWR